MADWLPPFGDLLGAAVLLLPGFVSIRTWEIMVPSRERDYAKSLIEFAGYSAMNYILVAPLLVWRLADWIALKFQWYDFLIVPLISIVVPILWPVGAYWVRRHARMAGLRDPTPTAWDWAMARGRQWVILHLRDGRRIGGFYGGNSYATEYPHEREIFLEEVWHLSDKGAFLGVVPSTSGIVVQGADIEFIEYKAT